MTPGLSVQYDDYGYPIIRSRGFTAGLRVAVIIIPMVLLGHFPSKSVRKKIIKACQKFFNQRLIDPDPDFNRDRDRDDFFSIKVWLKNFNQSLPEKFSARCGC